MPPTPSSASNEKKKQGGKMKEDSKPNDQEDKEADEKKLAEEFLATPLGRTIGITDEPNAATGGGGRDASNRDDPPCDVCKQPFAGTMHCGRCESVFYCGRDCQIMHWFAGGHKKECKQLTKQNEETAKRVLDEFKEVRGWEDLDATGVYNAAVRQGLHDKIREMLELDKAKLVDRYQCDSGDYICYTQCVMMGLFRGQRAVGLADPGGFDFNCVDGVRVSGYVKSHCDALNTWLQASVQLLRDVTDRATLRFPLLHRKAHGAAEHVWLGWTLLFLSGSAARAILSPSSSPTTSGSAEESSEQWRKLREFRARRIIRAFGEGIRLLPVEPRFAVVKTCVEFAAALVHVRTEEYGIGVDVEGMLNLQGFAKETFHHYVIPLATRSIENGGKLSAQELNAFMAQSSNVLGLHEKFAEMGII